MFRLLKKLLLCFVVNVLLVTCNSSSGVPRQDSSVQLSATSLPTKPSVRASYEWSAEPVVAIVPQVPGECFYCYFSFPPVGVLYSDGRQIVEHEMRLYERYLSHVEICNLLTEIDDSGFFEFTSEQYVQFYKSNHMKPSPARYWISVDAWKSNSLYLFSFGFLFSHYKDKVDWPDALRIPYERLTEFDPDSMQPYIPERVAVHIEKDPDLGFELETWAITSPSLSTLLERYTNTATSKSESSEGEIILAGDEAKAVLQQFDNRFWRGANVFKYNNERYLVAIRVLLPYERSGGSIESLPLIPDPGTRYLPTSMKCS